MTTTGRVQRRWGVTIVSTVAAVALAAGCTGDEGVQVVTEGADGAAALAAAVDATPQSGRFRSTMHMEMPEMSWGDEEITDETVADDSVPDEAEGVFPTSFDYAVEGEFSGDDVRVEFTGDFGSGEFRSEGIVVGGRTFTSADTMTGMGSMFGAVSTGDDEADGYLAEQQAAIDTALAGKDWVETPAPDDSDDEVADDEAWGDSDGLGAVLFGVGPIGSAADSLAVLDDVSDVREVEPVDVGGERLRKFVGEVGDDDALFGSWEYDSDEELSPEETERVERIEEYARSRTSSSVEVLVGPDGYVRRIELELSDDFEEQYRGCYYLNENGSLSITVELSDLGEPIEIVAPDPSTVIDESALEGLAGIFGPGTDDSESSFDSMSLVDMYGREEAEQMLRDGAGLIALDPATIPSLTDEQLDDLLLEIETAAEALPEYDTRLGSMNRLEMLEMIRTGTDMLGIESLDLSAQTDQQLADLINTFIDQQGDELGITGDESGFDENDEYEEYDEFEGCPA